MTTGTARDDVGARATARDALARELSPYFWHAGLDQLSDDGVVADSRRQSLNQADGLIRALTAAGLRIVDAAQDDRRIEALAAADRLLNLIKELDDNGLVVGEEPLCHYPCKYDAVSAQVLMEAAVNKLASRLSDDEDTGGEG